MRCPPPLLRLRSAGRGRGGGPRLRRPLSTLGTGGGERKHAFRGGELGVDVMRHRYHGASHQLLGIVVAGIVPTNVAELAIHSEPSRELLHDATLQLFGRQYLQIFRWTASAALPFLRGRVLSAERDQN